MDYTTKKRLPISRAPDYRNARALFAEGVRDVLDGKSIAETFAGIDRNGRLSLDGTLASSSNGQAAAADGSGRTASTSIGVGLNSSGRVVRSHLEYLRKHYEPFRRGVFNEDTLYGFLFFMVVERQRKVEYTDRVLKSILSYVRSPSAASLLTQESRAFLAQHPYGHIVKWNRFYKLVNRIGDVTGDEDLKRVVVNAKMKRPLVFSEAEENALINFCLATVTATVRKYMHANSYVVASDPYETVVIAFGSKPVWSNGVSENYGGEGADIWVRSGDYSPSSRRRDRIVFEFALVFLLGFLTGARIKSVVMRLKVNEMSDLFHGRRLEVLTKNSFATVFLPPQMLVDRAETASGDVAPNLPVVPIANSTVAAAMNDMRCVTELRRRSPLYDASATEPSIVDEMATVVLEADVPTSADKRKFFVSTARQLELMLDRVYLSLFGRNRERGVRWHSQRRGYLGEVSGRYGVLTASKSVGHADINTTMNYVNKSQHGSDTACRAGSAIIDRLGNV